VVYWQLVALGVACEVIAPSLIPTKAGDRVKTDRRDAVKLARCYRAGELTPVFVPDAATEGLRDVVRAREAAKQDLLRARHRLGKLLLRHGRQRPAGMRAWTQRHEQWLGAQRFAVATVQLADDEYRAAVSVLVARVARLEQAMRAGVATLRPAQQALVTGLAALRGVRDVTAITVVSEVTTLTRFAGARRDHQDGERAPQARAGGGGLGLSPPPRDDGAPAASPTWAAARRGRGGRTGAAATLCALSHPGGAREGTAVRGDDDCARAPGLRVGDRPGREGTAPRAEARMA